MKLDDLYAVNEKINSGSTYMTDPAQYDKLEFLEDIRKSRRGDCEDYAIAKFYELLDLGWPVEVLRLAKVYTEPYTKVEEDGSVRDATMEERYHEVLLARLNGVDYCLCNRIPIPKPAILTGYLFDLVQEPGTPYFKRVAGSPSLKAT